LFWGKDRQMTLSLLLSILLMPGVALAERGVVAGTLRGADGKPAARMRVAVMAMPEAGRGLRGAGTLVSQAETDAAGRFQLEDVPPGRYYVVAGKLQTPIFYPGVRDIAAAKTIQVLAKATVRDIDFEVGVLSAPSSGSTSSLPVVRVTGRVVLKNNAPVPPNITLQAFPPAGGALAAARASSFPTQTLPVAQDGTFSADLFGVDQHLSVVGLPAGYSFVSITSGGTNLLNQPILIKAGVELIVTVDVGDVWPRYRLMALVREDSTDRLLSGEHVELVHSSGEVVRLTVNPQGMVTFPRLLPGTYVLRLASAGFDVPEKQVVITDGSVQVELQARKKP
jgi:hypothetical protein